LVGHKIVPNQAAAVRGKPNIITQGADIHDLTVRGVKLHLDIFEPPGGRLVQAALAFIRTDEDAVIHLFEHANILAFQMLDLTQGFFVGRVQQQTLVGAHIECACFHGQGLHGQSCEWPFVNGLQCLVFPTRQAFCGSDPKAFRLGI